jgi:hypothetical protein
MSFRYALGALVVAKSSLESAVQELTLPESYERRRLDSMWIMERLSCECVGGTQLFYHCQRWDGSVGRYAEGSLVTVVDAYDTWRHAIEANKKVIA